MDKLINEMMAELEASSDMLKDIMEGVPWGSIEEQIEDNKNIIERYINERRNIIERYENERRNNTTE